MPSKRTQSCTTVADGLHSTLKLAVGARIVLTVNVDVSDGLVNGARGGVVHIVTNTQCVVTVVLIKFDSPEVGLKAVHSSPYRATFTSAVSLGKLQVTFLARGKRGSEVTHLQFPLTLAWATTVHQVQEQYCKMEGGKTCCTVDIRQRDRWQWIDKWQLVHCW